jgi:hypothetical protein
LAIDFGDTDSDDGAHMHDAGLEALRLGNPAARSLPLLAALARCESVKLSLGPLRVELTPCA